MSFNTLVSINFSSIAGATRSWAITWHVLIRLASNDQTAQPMRSSYRPQLRQICGIERWDNKILFQSICQFVRQFRMKLCDRNLDSVLIARIWAGLSTLGLGNKPVCHHYSWLHQDTGLMLLLDSQHMNTSSQSWVVSSSNSKCYKSQLFLNWNFNGHSAYHRNVKQWVEGWRS